MQNVAAELKHGATAFLLAQKGEFDLRWFTPTVEIDLCGHATLASAHAVWEENILGGPVPFNTRSGLLIANRSDDWIELDFPATLATPVAAPQELLEALGVKPVYAGKNKFDYILELGSEEEVRAVTPDLAALRKLPVRGVIITSKSSSRDYDFVSRFFAPGSGIDEDNVTGSAHCCLAPYWSSKMGKNEFVAYQASKRGGTLKLRLDGNRVKLLGRAVTVLRGEIVV